MLLALASRCFAGCAPTRAAIATTAPAKASPRAPEPHQLAFSFYKVGALPPTQLPSLRASFLGEWAPLGTKGRVYLAHDGVNAIISIPHTQLAPFCAPFLHNPVLKAVPLNFIRSSLPPEWATSEPFKNGSLFSPEDTHLLPSVKKPPSPSSTKSYFDDFHVKIRPSIVNAGQRSATGSLDTIQGRQLSPAEWHAAVDNPANLVIDLRNVYESEIGRFDSVYRPPAQTFRESLPLVIEKISKFRKENGSAGNVMMYCTGGVRCEVASKILEANGAGECLQLHGGIQNYVQYVKANNIPSKFKGGCFIFAEQSLKEDVTMDVLAHCFNCMRPTSTHRNCVNPSCGACLVQCPACTSQLQGACSPECAREATSSSRPRRKAPHVRLSRDMEELRE